MEAYLPIQPELLSRYLNTALKKAHESYKQHHSNNETGENAEDVPFWMRGFFDLFRAKEADIPLPLPTSKHSYYVPTFPQASSVSKVV